MNMRQLMLNGTLRSLLGETVTSRVFIRWETAAVIAQLLAHPLN
jgi:hypothetical protein